MKDYRLSEIRDICKKQRPNGDNGVCDGCPIFDVCINQLDAKLPCEWEIDFEYEKAECIKIAEYGSATTISISPTDEPMVVKANTPDEFIIYNEENKNDK